MAIKTIVDEKGLYVAAGSSASDTGFQQTYGGTVVEPDNVGGAVTLTLTSSFLAVTASVNTTCTLPTSPRNGQVFEIAKATSVAMTVSITGSNGAHTINGSAAAVALLTTAGKKAVSFVGSPANMWVTSS